MSDKKIIKEDIKIAVEQVFKDNPMPEPKRIFIGARGCATYGLVDFNSSMWHCGDENCAGCNQVYKAMNSAVEDMVKELQFKIDLQNSLKLPEI